MFINYSIGLKRCEGARKHLKQKQIKTNYKNERTTFFCAAL